MSMCPNTEDWSNDAENSAFHHRNKLHLIYIYIQNITIFTVHLCEQSLWGFKKLTDLKIVFFILYTHFYIIYRNS